MCGFSSEKLFVFRRDKMIEIGPFVQIVKNMIY